VVLVENIALGADNRLKKQVRDLLAAGYRVSVITRREPLNVPWQGIEHLRLLQYPPPAEPRHAVGYLREYAVSLLWAAALLGRLRLRGPIDTLQLCQPPDIYFPLAWVMRAAGARVVVDQRDLMPEVLVARYGHAPRVLTRALAWLERRTVRAAHATITVNDHLRDRLVSSGARRDSVAVVRNGPLLASLDRAVPDPTIRVNQHMVCWLGKMGRQDRVDLVIKVAELVVHDHGRRDCSFVLAGDGECLQDLRGLAASRGLDPWVTFTGWLPEPRVFDLLASCDVGLDASLQAEVSPVKVMEYMGCGLPTVCFDLPETRRISNGAAVLVPPGDTKALANALLRLVDDPQRRRVLGMAGRRYVHDWLAWDRQSSGYLQAIRPPRESRPSGAAQRR
jgi:glycosyltransferase involved in cell wall biosynthesis